MTVKENMDKVIEQTQREFINVYRYKRVTFGNSEEEKEEQERRKRRRLNKMEAKGEVDKETLKNEEEKDLMDDE